MSDDVTAEHAWAADMLYGSEPSVAPPTEIPNHNLAESASTPEENQAVEGSVELDAAADPESTQDVNASAKRAAIVLGLAVMCAVGAVALTLANSRESGPPPHPEMPALIVAPAAAPQGVTTPTADHDHPIPYTASANCPAGSTSAQALTDTETDSAWVCVRGPQDATVDGQVLHVDFGQSFVITAVCATPGWVAKTPAGKDEWLQHRVVTRLQYIFDDTDHTVITQDTGNTHGPVTIALPAKVMASAATVVILQTSRPPASPLPAASPDTLALPGFGDSMFGADGAPLPSDTTMPPTEPLSVDGDNPDPVDASFAMSQLTFLGHEPN